MNGGADFYAKDAEGLRREGAISLQVFFDACKEDNVDPFKSYSGKFMLRVQPEDHAAIALAAKCIRKKFQSMGFRLPKIEGLILSGVQ